MKAAFITLSAATVALAAVATVSEEPLAQIKKAQATTLPEVTTSNIKGLAFDRFYQVWLENIVSLVPQCPAALAWLTFQCRIMRILPPMRT